MLFVWIGGVIEKCPKCGGDTGFLIIHWVQKICMFTWDGEEDGGENGAQSYGGKMAECMDCKAKFNLAKLTKRIEEEKNEY